MADGWKGLDRSALSVSIPGGYIEQLTAVHVVCFEIAPF
jgi:hypothetical protein